jgi:hypothetical protein
MSFSDPAELKRKLRAAGFEVYRASSEQVLLAERVRDNLIMDSGVAAHMNSRDGEIWVEVTVRAQASHFPGAEEEGIWTHARLLAQAFLDSGYTEEGSRATPVPDPNDPQASLDTAHEIRLRRAVGNAEALFDELRAALQLPRATSDD